MRPCTGCPKIKLIRGIFVSVFDYVMHENNPIDFFVEPLNTSDNSKSKKTYLMKFLKTIFFWETPCSSDRKVLDGSFIIPTWSHKYS